jgi:hypothetical protein
MIKFLCMLMEKATTATKKSPLREMVDAVKPKQW